MAQIEWSSIRRGPTARAALEMHLIALIKGAIRSLAKGPCTAWLCLSQPSDITARTFYIEVSLGRATSRVYGVIVIESLCECPASETTAQNRPAADSSPRLCCQVEVHWPVITPGRPPYRDAIIRIDLIFAWLKCASRQVFYAERLLFAPRYAAHDVDDLGLR